MRAFTTILVLLVILTFTANNLSAQHYYEGDKQVALKIDSNKIMIRFDTSLAEDQKLELTANIDRLDKALDDDLVFDQFKVYSLKSNTDHTAFLDSLHGLSGIEMVEPYYLTNDGHPLPITSQSPLIFTRYFLRVYPGKRLIA